jgi:hypothetical protein
MYIDDYVINPHIVDNAINPHIDDNAIKTYYSSPTPSHVLYRKTFFEGWASLPRCHPLWNGSPRRHPQIALLQFTAFTCNSN